MDPFQPVSVGQILVQGNGISAAEAVVQVPLPAFQRLLFPMEQPENLLDAIREGPATRIEAKLHPLSEPAQVWQATVSRIEGALDPRARSVPVVVSVSDPYAKAAPPVRLPLVPNMQVEVTLTGAVVSDAIVIPESALHGDHVYLASADNRLELRHVTPAFQQFGQVVIGAGLAPGDRLVLDEIAPALPGMALRPVEVAP